MKRSSSPVGAAALSIALTIVPAPVATSASAQTMGLQECIDYALGHNTTVRQQTIAAETQRISLSTARSSRLPDVSASLGQGWGFGRSTGRDGSTVDQTSAQTSFSIGASLPVFTGFRIPNQVRAERFQLEAALANLDKARLDVGIQVSGCYLNALYYKGLTGVQRRQVELDSVALANARALYEAGRKPESEVAAAEAQVAVSRHSLTEAEGNETLARLELMQMLNLEGSVENFAILDIDTASLASGIMPADEVFTRALETHPAILAARYNLESSKYSLRATRSGYMPTLSVSASYSNSYYHLYGGDNASLSRQLDLNGSEYIGLSLNIPIFDRFSTRNALRQSRLSIESQHVALDEAKQSLNKEIQQAYWNAVKARDNFTSAQLAATSTSLAYRYEAECYAAGKGTGYELQQAATKMQQASQDALQAKYEYLMRIKILEFYNGE